jgi:hypothetical protein
MAKILRFSWSEMGPFVTIIGIFGPHVPWASKLRVLTLLIRTHSDPRSRE